MPGKAGSWPFPFLVHVPGKSGNMAISVSGACAGDDWEFAVSGSCAGKGREAGGGGWLA